MKLKDIHITTELVSWNYTVIQENKDRSLQELSYTIKFYVKSLAD